MSNIVIIQGHPDPNQNHQDHSLIENYIKGAESQNHKVELINIANLDFPLLRTSESWKKGKSDTPKQLVPIQDAIANSDHIVLIYPLWLGTMPALLKGFLEQVLRPGFAIEENSKGFPKGLLRNKSSHIIITMGMPAFIYRFYFFSHSLRSLKRNILNFVGIKKIKTTIIGSVETLNENSISKWFNQMKKAGEVAN